jgi:hypothetical protein
VSTPARRSDFQTTAEMLSYIGMPSSASSDGTSRRTPQVGAQDDDRVRLRDGDFARHLAQRWGVDFGE